MINTTCFIASVAATGQIGLVSEETDNSLVLAAVFGFGLAANVEVYNATTGIGQVGSFDSNIDDGITGVSGIGDAGATAKFHTLYLGMTMILI